VRFWDGDLAGDVEAYGAEGVVSDEVVFIGVGADVSCRVRLSEGVQVYASGYEGGVEVGCAAEGGGEGIGGVGDVLLLLVLQEEAFGIFRVGRARELYLIAFHGRFLRWLADSPA
jgi:hypothetical protein